MNLARLAALLGAILPAFCRSAADAQELGLTVQTGHRGSLGAMAVSGDGATLLTAGHDGVAQLWEYGSGRVLRRWVAGTRQGREAAKLQGAALSGDGKSALTIDAAGFLDLRDSETGEARHGWQIEDAPLGIALTPDGGAVTAATDAEIRVWNARDFAVKWRWPAEAQSAFSAFAQSADGNYLAAGIKRGRVRVFSLADGKEVSTLDTRIGAVTGLAFCGKENRLLVASGSPQVAVWRAADGQNDGELTFPRSARTLSGNQGSLVSAFDDAGGLMFANVQNRAAWPLPPGPETVCASLTSSATSFLAGRPDGTAELCEITTGFFQRRFESAIAPQAARRWFSTNVLVASGVPSDALPRGANAQEVIDGLYAPSGRSFAGRTRAGKWYLWRAGDQKWLSLNPQSVAAEEAAKPAQSTNTPLNTKVPQNAPAKPTITVKPKADNQQVVFSAEGSRLLLTDGDEASVFETARGTLQVSWRSSTEKPGVALKTGEAFMSIALSPDGRFAGAIMNDRTLRVWQVEGAAVPNDVVPNAAIPDAASMGTFEAPSGYFTALALTETGSLVTGSNDGAIYVWDTEGQKERIGQALGSIEAVVWSGGVVFAATSEGEIWRFGEEGGDGEHVLAHPGGIDGLELLADKIHLLSCGADGALRFFDVADLAPRGAIYGLKKSGWLALENDEKFDSSNGAAPVGLHRVQGLKSSSLDRDGARFRDAGWVAARFGMDKPRSTPGPMGQGAPLLKLEILKGAERTLQIDVTNQGGGIGPISVSINGTEISRDGTGVPRDARGLRFDSTLPRAVIPFELPEAKIRPGRRNWIRVVAKTAAGAAAGAELSTEAWMPWDAPGVKKPRQPRFWGIFVGVSETRADPLKVQPLRYATVDARALATALLPAARRQFRPENVGFRLFSSDPRDLETPPLGVEVKTASKSNLTDTLQRLARDAYEEDTVMIFLAGHGVTYDPKGATYAFLTSEATTADLTDAAFRSKWALTGEELADAVLHINAGDVAIILDTCAAGVAVNLDKNAQTSAFDANNGKRDNFFVKRDSFFVLAGTAATAQSYEIPALRHGILTYALLQGLKGDALRQAIEPTIGAFPGAIGLEAGPTQSLNSFEWLTYAKKQGAKIARRYGVPQQEPVLQSKFQGDAPLGQFTTADSLAIEIEGELPFLLAPRFKHATEGDDTLHLEENVGALLKDQAEKEGATFNFEDDGDKQVVGSIQPRGLYTQQGDLVTVTLSFYEGKNGPETKAKRTLKAPVAEVADAVAKAIAEAMGNGVAPVPAPVAVTDVRGNQNPTPQ